MGWPGWTSQEDASAWRHLTSVKTWQGFGVLQFTCLDGPGRWLRLTVQLNPWHVYQDLARLRTSRHSIDSKLLWNRNFVESTSYPLIAGFHFQSSSVRSLPRHSNGGRFRQPAGCKACATRQGSHCPRCCREPLLPSTPLRQSFAWFVSSSLKRFSSYWISLETCQFPIQRWQRTGRRTSGIGSTRTMTKTSWGRQITLNNRWTLLRTDF